MALVPCRECNTPVAYKAPSCPKCGELDPSHQKRKSKLLSKLFGLVVVIVAGSYLWFFVIPDIKQNGPLNHTGQR